MNSREIIIKNIDKLHTTPLGLVRIKKNINIDNLDEIKKLIIDDKSNIYKKGKNYYLENSNIIITINSYNYCVITAHKKAIN